MRRIDRITIDFIRNWKGPGQHRLSHFFKPSKQLRASIKQGIIWLKDENIALYVTADNYIEWTIMSTGTYEDEINKLIRISVSQGDTCLDIGGNIGLQSLRMSQCVGLTGSVFSFEPLAHLRERLNRNLMLNRVSNVTLFPFALSDQNYVAQMNIDEEAWNQGAFSLRNESKINYQDVTVKIADDLEEIRSIERLSLIKIDVEGFEFNVLKGLRETLIKHLPRIIFEYDSNYWKLPEQNALDCCNFLFTLGYKLYQITSIGAEPITSAHDISNGNIFCVNNAE